MNTIGTQIREWRERRGWSQERLARKLGVCKSTIQKLEHGTRRLGAKSLNKFIEAGFVHFGIAEDRDA